MRVVGVWTSVLHKTQWIHRHILLFAVDILNVYR